MKFMTILLSFVLNISFYNSLSLDSSRMFHKNDLKTQCDNLNRKTENILSRKFLPKQIFELSHVIYELVGWKTKALYASENIKNT